MLGSKQPWRETFRSLRGTSTFRFFATAFVAYVVWSVAYEQALKPKTMLDELVIGHMVSATECVMQALEWPVGTYPQAATHRNRVGVAGHVGVRIGAPCDGVALFALFTIFVLAFPGAVHRKLWFIPAGTRCCTRRTFCALCCSSAFKSSRLNGLNSITIYVHGVRIRLGVCTLAFVDGLGPNSRRKIPNETH